MEQFSTSPIYTNDDIPYLNTVEVADFNKDGWNDLLIDREAEEISLFLNSRTGNFFGVSPTESFNFVNYPGPLGVPPLFGRQLIACDLYNKGGLGVILSGWIAVTHLLRFETAIRINAENIDPPPAPAYLFKSTIQDGEVYHPRLLLFNRGDRDFLKYKIYKKNPYTYQYYILFDSTTSSDYVDVTEDLLVNPGIPNPGSNLYYYVTSEDQSCKESISSDTIEYYTLSCPLCGSEEGSRPGEATIETESPTTYFVSNYPNPFNPTTTIYYEIPSEGNVKVTIYNSVCQKVIELVNEYKQAGKYHEVFNRSELASGIYYYRLETKGFFQTKKMMLLK